MSAAYDLVVIGGGLVGGAIAWGAAAEGAHVALVDEGDIAFRASRGNFGQVWIQGKGEGFPDYAHLTQRSAELWPTLARRLADDTGIDVALRQSGGLDFCLGEAEIEERRRSIETMNAESGSIGTRIVGRQELQDMVPLALGSGVAGASFCPRDGHVNPLLFMRALHRGLIARGGSYLPGRTVERIVPSGQDFAAESGAERIVGRKLVVAAGLGSRALAPMVGLSMRVSPLQGQILVTERVQPFPDLLISSIRQTENGSIMLGSSRNDVDFDTRTDPRTGGGIAARAVAALPALAQLQVVRTWAALRIMTPDGFPIYQESERYPGAFAATCHSGVTLGGAHALEVAPAILSGAIAQNYRSFSSRRFDVSQV